jgi:predicted secreted protein
MSLTLAIATYVVIWWTVLFAILPIGVRTQGEEGVIVPGTPASAPARLSILRIVLLTTLASTLVFGALWLVAATGILDVNRLLGRPV